MRTSQPRLRRSATQRVRGFSLIELTVTVLLIGILAAAASPQFAAALTHYRAEAVAARIAADLNFARRTAVNTSTDCTVLFTSAPDVYQMTGVTDPHHPSQSYAVTLTDLADGAVLSSANFDGNTDITFNTYGLPQTGAPSTPLTSGSITIIVGSEQRTVVITPSTGQATVQ